MHVSARTRKLIDVDKMLVLVAKAKARDGEAVREWWTRLAHSGPRLVHCRICGALIEGAKARALAALEDFDQILDQHAQTHAQDAQTMIDTDVWPTLRRKFDQWCDQVGPVPHDMFFDVPCVRWCVIRVLNLTTLMLVRTETIQAAIKRCMEDETFCDALDAAADVPSGITTLLESQF